MLRVSGKSVDVGESLRTRITEKVDEALSKYFHHGSSGHVTISREGSGFRADCVLHLDSGTMLEAHGSGQDAVAAADEAAGKIENRLRRYKRRLKDRSATIRAQQAQQFAANYVIEAPDEKAEEQEGWSPVTIAESTAALPEFSVSDAVAELDLTGAQVIVFRHAGSGGINIVYKRRDGNIGWIDPSPQSAK
ncbi:MAG: ribosome-associated translation inhibitor RaiA [Xanthobacteraceae bacterium]|nr:ribosome-associated translation inhibitor RaiA [Xanthobacteraceae bacterium]